MSEDASPKAPAAVEQADTVSEVAESTTGLAENAANQPADSAAAPKSRSSRRARDPNRQREHKDERKPIKPRAVRDEDLDDGEDREEPVVDKGKPPKARKDGYVNPDRVQTGGSQREKMTPEQLAERMERIRLQNEKIKEKREDKVSAEVVQQKAERAAIREKQARGRKIQEAVDNERFVLWHFYHPNNLQTCTCREQNAKRKLERMGAREWDMDKDEKPSQGSGRGRGRGGDWGFRGQERGRDFGSRSPRGRGEGRGAGRGGGPKLPADLSSQTDFPSLPTDAPASGADDNHAVASTSQTDA
ncbi:hypothetical protein BOTBODRAFT_422206 [Botryobasidium botryosum FD-172 SS1]|uniref:Uncharacterized protein n=1 Tax=Botryobasidium botryosum (strain FD-172 SS1) TaxID=930990 RepID=A0A067MCF0_BOTB1|nr:hypothetical protein BOTBODRAFT_422206 [Botryobasidium botryosum FD-172 SS1]